MNDKLEYIKMKERLDWSLENLKKLAQNSNLQVSDDVLFVQACEMARTLFVRSEISYSSKSN